MQQQDKQIKYIHQRDTHNLHSPNVIVPYLITKFKPVSVVDVGCGIGTFLHVFKQYGVKNILGIDGKWVNKDQLYIDSNEFMEADLEKLVKVDKTFDLVLCLEVAEHLSIGSADTLVDNLTRLGKTIVFSAATSKQGGQNHLNEQPFSYWKEKFAIHGYRVIDLFRPAFWNEKTVQWWYKQNMFLIVHHSLNTLELELNLTTISEEHLLIHPELFYERMLEFEKKNNDLQKMYTGRGGNFNLYLKLLYLNIINSFRAI